MRYLVASAYSVYSVEVVASTWWIVGVDSSPGVTSWDYWHPLGLFIFTWRYRVYLFSFTDAGKGIRDLTMRVDLASTHGNRRIARGTRRPTDTFVQRR